MNSLTFYNKTSIWVFSIFLTGLGGAIMLSHNLRAAGKSKVIAPLIILTLIGNASIRQMVKNALPGSLTEVVIPNLICGLLLAFPVWNSHLLEFTDYRSKQVWWPLFAVVLLWGGLYLWNLFVANGPR